MKKKEMAPNTTLILYSDIFSSAENLNYWQQKLEKQMKASSPFGLVAIINETHVTERNSVIGCECRLFQELDSAICWPDQKDKTFVLS